MPLIDMNELKKRDPLDYHRRLAISRAGEVRLHKEELSNARNSVERDRAQRKVNRAEAEVAYHRRHIDDLTKAKPAKEP